jgi:hypothetical protein
VPSAAFNASTRAREPADRGELRRQTRGEFIVCTQPSLRVQRAHVAWARVGAHGAACDPAGPRPETIWLSADPSRRISWSRRGANTRNTRSTGLWWRPELNRSAR